MLDRRRGSSDAGSRRLTGSAPNGLEMRSAPRVGVRIDASVYLAGTAGWFPCQLRDIGSGGACLQTAGPIDLTTLRRLRFTLQDGPIELDVSGCWQREAPLEHAMFSGVRFESPSPAVVERIAEHVNAVAFQLARFVRTESELADLDLDEAIDFALSSRLRHASAGTYIYRGDRAGPGEESVYLVLQGTVALELSLRASSRFEVARVERGGVFGGMRVVAREGTRLSAVACTELVLLELDFTAFRYLDRAKPTVARRISETVVTKGLLQLHACVDRLAARSR